MERLPNVIGQVSPIVLRRRRRRFDLYPLHNDPLSLIPDMTEAEEINSNGTSVVWKVPFGEKYIVLKEINKASLFTESLRANATAEVAALRALQHPNIVEFGGAFQTHDNLYIAMRYHRQDLYKYTTSNYIVKTQDAERWITQLASALAYMKTKGFLHRDIKLENVLRTSRNNVRLADFGLSILKEDVLSTEAVGTRHCIAPEVKAGLPQGYEIDAWGLGVLLFELLSGAIPPFTYKMIRSPYAPGHQPFEKSILRSSSAKCMRLLRGFLQCNPHNRLTVEDLDKSQMCIVC